MAHSIDTEKVRADLVARLAQLDDKVHDIEGELESHHNRDWSEGALEREGDEVLERQGTAAQAEMAAIRAALVRLDAGEYGFCVQCGADIAPARLALVPHTPLCAACAGARAR